METPQVREQPRSNLPTCLRSGLAAITRQYRAFRQATFRPRTTVIPTESADDNEEPRRAPDKGLPLRMETVEHDRAHLADPGSHHRRIREHLAFARTALEKV
jgi:hypothetical protein